MKIQFIAFVGLYSTFILGHNITQAAGDPTPIWRPVKVPEVFLVMRNRTDVEYHSLATTTIQCLQYCIDFAWCALSCFEGNVCISSRNQVSPHYIPESGSQNSRSCYTKNGIDFSTNAIVVEATEVHSNFPLRVATNVVTGMFSYDRDFDCYSSKNDPPMLFLLDLKSLKPIHNLRVYGFPNPTHLQKAAGLQFFSGEIVNMDDIRSGNPQNLDLLGTIPPNLMDDWIDFPIKPTKMARYIVAIKFSLTLHFCTITIT